MIITNQNGSQESTKPLTKYGSGIPRDLLEFAILNSNIQRRRVILNTDLNKIERHFCCWDEAQGTKP